MNSWNGPGAFAGSGLGTEHTFVEETDTIVLTVALLLLESQLCFFTMVVQQKAPPGRVMVNHGYVLTRLIDFCFLNQRWRLSVL